MTPKTLAALEGSIKKWEAISKGLAQDHGTDDCPLCHIFYAKADSVYDRCVGCPVRAASGRSRCASTPYIEFHAEKQLNPHSPAYFTAAQAELEFLRSLLPKEPLP